ncbi:MAG: diacylglycerol kinase, partial [Peptidiphaga sp.]
LRVDDGWLDLVVVDTKIGLLGWGDLVRRVGLQSLGLRRRPQMLPEVGSIELRRMRSVHVQAGDPELVEADGDALGYAWNVRARIERGTLLVHVL